ncbi:MAG TPA: TlpA disulfide reductase family protein [Mucilaginibacter sp.]|jgi:thiol-disulfide isomerase/thioredoxin|nr:TlpA disulfide reductase family protein [Mucilaginibacter sp.]
MTKYLLLTILILNSIISSAQSNIKIPIEQFGLNEKTVVTDSSGIKYTYSEWKKLVGTGKYRLRPVHDDSDTTAFILAKRDKKIDDELAANAPEPDEAPFFKTGAPFNFFDMKDINGADIKSADLQGKIVVVNFWFIACPRCRYETPELNRLVKEYKDNKDIVFVAITFDRLPDVQKFLNISPFEYRVVSDAWPQFKSYKITECPVNLVVDKKGMIRFNSLGYDNGNVPYWINKTIRELK